MNSLTLKSFIVSILCTSLVAIGDYSHPRNLQTFKNEAEESVVKISLNTPAIHDLVYLKHIANENGQRYEIPALNMLRNSMNLETNADNGVPIIDFVETFFYGTVYWGLPPQEFSVLYDTALLPTVLVNQTGCQSAKCKSDWPRRFKTTKSVSYHGQVIPNYESKVEVGNDIFTILKKKEGEVFATTTNFFLVNGEFFPKPEGFIVTPHVPQLDGVFSLGFSSPVWPIGETPMENLLKQFKSKQLSIWLAQSKRLEFTKPIAAELTFGGLDKTHCKNDWQFMEVPSNAWQWSVPLTKFQFGKVTADLTDQIAVISSMHMFIYGPEKLLQPLVDKTEPYTNGSQRERDVGIKCKGGAVRKGLPNLKFTIGSKIYELTPQQYIIDIAPEIDLCHLTVRPFTQDIFQLKKQIPENAWYFGQTFLSAYCTAFDFTPNKRLVGLATPMNMN